MAESVMYHEGNRQLQDRFDSRRISDRLEEKLMRKEFSADDKHFIESLPYFFLATADAEGRPDCSFKGGAPGFVRITGPSEIAFPDYDGNGMFKSLGNIVRQCRCRSAVHRHARQAAAPAGQRQRTRERQRSAAGGDRRRAAHRPRNRAGDLSELSALYSDAGGDRAVDVCTRCRPGRAGAGVERLCGLQGLHSSTAADIQGLAAAT
jgi:predicted pyridoxine 5'-phosphate oxidase superfamily flavin-nucleotide-binding protein